MSIEFGSRRCGLRCPRLPRVDGLPAAALSGRSIGAGGRPACWEERVVGDRGAERKMPRLDLVFVEVTEKNVEQLRLMNELIFPVRYNDQFYKDVYKNQKLAQFGAPTLVDLPASPRYPSAPTAGAWRPTPPALTLRAALRCCGRPVQ